MGKKAKEATLVFLEMKVLKDHQVIQVPMVHQALMVAQENKAEKVTKEILEEQDLQA